MYVCHTITFESLNIGSSRLHMQYVYTAYGLSSYIGHRVKVEVTGAKKVGNFYSRNVQVAQLSQRDRAAVWVSCGQN